MLSHKEMEYFVRRADIVEDIQKVMKHIDPTINELTYKVNTNTGDESVEIRYASGVIRKVSITRKAVKAILQSLMRYAK